MFWKSPMQMSREAEERRNPKRRAPKPARPKPSTVNPDSRPLLDDPTFAAWLRTGLSKR